MIMLGSSGIQSQADGGGTGGGAFVLSFFPSFLFNDL